MGFLARLFITGLGLLLADALLPGVRFDGVLSLWLLVTLPLTLLTLGLFLFVVNGLMVLLVAWLMPSFHIAGMWSAILASVIVGLTGWFANAFVGRHARIEVWSVKKRGQRG